MNCWHDIMKLQNRTSHGGRFEIFCTTIKQSNLTYRDDGFSESVEFVKYQSDILS